MPAANDIAISYLAGGNECLYPCAVLLSQALCDVSRIGVLGLSSVLAHFAYGHIHTALFNCQETVICGGSYQICGIHYGDSVQITNDSNYPLNR